MTKAKKHVVEVLAVLHIPPNTFWILKDENISDVNP